MAAASENRNVKWVAFWDGPNVGARYAAFDSNGPALVVPQGELNTGAASTLHDFVVWSQQNYPAPHYALVISDHGTGLGGVAGDMHTPDYKESGDWLTPGELQLALQGVDRLGCRKLIDRPTGRL